MPNFLDYAALLICKYRNKEKAPTVGKVQGMRGGQ